MCSTRACRPAAPMVLALTDTGSARTGRGVICTPAFCMACASASVSVSVQPCWRGGSGPRPGFWRRIFGGQALGERHKEYVEAARGLGVSGWRIMVRHILPNCLPPLIVIGTLQIARAITLEATLSFLGLGVPITEPSLGLLIANGYQYMLSGEYWISFYPGIA